MEQQFLTDNYYVLLYLHDKRGLDNTIAITQQEIGDHLSLSRTTINHIMRDLRKDGYLQDEGHVGRYIVTPKALVAIKHMAKMESILKVFDAQ